MSDGSRGLPGKLASVAARLASRYRLRKCTSVGEGTRATGHVWVWGGGRVVVGARVLFDARTAPIELHALEGAEIEVQDDVVIHGGASIEAVQRVSIGARSRLGPYAKIMDNHFHMSEDRQKIPPAMPVVVEEDAVLGASSIVIGGQVGRGAVIGARAVVTRKIPAHATAHGNPLVIRRSA